MKIEHASLGALKTNAWNPNKMPKRKFEALKAQLSSEGYNSPILVRAVGGSLEIVDGEHRYRAMLELYGADHQVEVVVLDVDDTRAKLNTLAMNRIRGEHAPLAEALVLSDLLRTMTIGELETRLGMPNDQIEDLVALLGEEPPAPQDRVPMVEVTIALFRDQVEVYTQALERAIEIVSPKAIPLMGEQTAVFDAAMKKAKRLLETANRARAIEMICANFLATPDDSLV